MKEGQSTDILNLFLFRTNPAVDFSFASMAIMVCNGRDVANVFVTVCDGIVVMSIAICDKG